MLETGDKLDYAIGIVALSTIIILEIYIIVFKKGTKKNRNSAILCILFAFIALVCLIAQIIT